MKSLAIEIEIGYYWANCMSVVEAWTECGKAVSQSVIQDFYDKFDAEVAQWCAA